MGGREGFLLLFLYNIFHVTRVAAVKSAKTLYSDNKSHHRLQWTLITMSWIVCSGNGGRSLQIGFTEKNGSKNAKGSMTPPPLL